MIGRYRRVRWGGWALAAASCGLAALFISAPVSAADLLGSIGRFLGNPLGGFIEAATLPTVQRIEGVGQRLVSDVDARLSTRIGQVEHTGQVLIASANQSAEARVRQADVALQARLSQADGVMTARIVQLDSSLDARIAQALGGIQAAERTLVRGAHEVVSHIDAAAQQRIAQADSAIEQRITQARAAIQDAISQADSDVEARIAQLDEVAERRLGSVDVIATKLSLNLQITLLKVGAMLGMVAFLVFALRYLFEHVPRSLARLTETRPTWGAARRGAMVSATSLGWLLAHLVAGAAVVGGFAVLADRLPVGARKQLATMTSDQQRALHNSYARRDFSRVRYHAAQLALLDPDGDDKYRALELRAGLIRDVFARPGLLATPDGVRELSERIAQAAAAQQRAGASAEGEADLLAITCYLQWQLARTRSAELDAVTRCAQAIDAAGVAQAFSLAPLAGQYLRLFLAREPIPYVVDAAHPYGPDQLAQRAQRTAAVAVDPPLSAALKYDALVLELERSAGKAYVAMLEAHAALVASAADGGGRDGLSQRDARCRGDAGPKRELLLLPQQVQRLEQACALIEAYRTFDSALEHAPELQGTPQRLAALMLNDAPLSQALWFEVHPDAKELPPRIRDEKDPAVRAAMAPIRIAWARRYLTTASAQVQQLVGADASERFATGEELAGAFAESFVAYRVATAAAADSGKVAQLRLRAARAAGAFDLYTAATASEPVRPFGLALLREVANPAAQDVAAVHKAYAGTRLRLL